MYKVNIIEDGTKQNTIVIADTPALFRYVQKLVEGYNAFDWKYISIQLAEFVEFAGQCYIDVGYTTMIKIEEC